MSDDQVPTAHTYSQFIQMMEDGELHAELSKGLHKINAALNQHVIDFGGTPKGKLTVNVEIKLEKGVFEILGSYDIKLPKVPRGRTVAWSTPDNRFTPQNPHQMQLFGVREVAGHNATEEARQV